MPTNVGLRLESIRGRIVPAVLVSAPALIARLPLLAPTSLAGIVVSALVGLAGLALVACCTGLMVVGMEILQSTL